MNYLQSAFIGVAVTVGLVLLAIAGQRLSPGAAWLGVACVAAAAVAAVTVGAP
jgi:hypothetical protein